MQKRYFSSNIIFLLISFVTGFNALGQDRINPRSLKEKCKSLTIRIYCIIENYDNPGIWRKCYYDDCDSLFFDQKGNVLKSFSFDENWKKQKAEFEYDNLSNRIRSKSYDSNGKLLNHSEFKYKYDHKGHIIEDQWTETGSAIVNNSREFKITSKYDESGNKTESRIINANGEVSSKNIYKYNDNNQLIEESFVFPENIESQKEVYRYDILGNRALQEHYNKGKLYSKINWIYDSKHNLIEVTEYEKKGDELKFVSRSSFKYDDHGNQIEESTSNEKGELLSSVNYRYQYDQKGNWRECIFYDTKNIPGRKIVRKIEYY